MHRRNRVAVEAPAKINLHLDITGLAGNGYHTLDSVLQAVDLSDLVVVGRREAPGIRVTCSRPGVPEDEANLAHRAAAVFFAAAGLDPPGLHIHIDKAIPAEAGLGGGSADAAAVLVGLNGLCGAGLPPERLCELGLRVGADVPFLIRGGCAQAEGVGERLTPMFPGLRPCSIVIAKPGEGVSTELAYQLYDGRAGIGHLSSDGMRRAVATGSLEAAGRRLFNVFEQVLDGAETARIKAVMLRRGALGALLSGSGSAVFGLFAGRDAAARCMEELRGSVREVFLAGPALHGARILHVG